MLNSPLTYYNDYLTKNGYNKTVIKKGDIKL